MVDGQTNQEWKPNHNPWLIALVVALAAFLEVLDTSINNVALPHIAGDLGASQDQSTWVLTTYLVANAIVLPITGWISSFLGRKRFFMICIGLFTVASLFCGIAPSLPVLLCFLAFQGAAGGGLQPMSQSIMADSFPPKLRGAAFALFGMTVVGAPALGPILGGWITDNYTWRWIFLMNLPIGLLVLVLVVRFVEDPPYLLRLKPGEMRFDSVGFSLLALGVLALQVLLDKGQEDDWLASHFINSLIAIAVVSLGTLIVWEWRQKQPIVDVRLFKSVNFSGACLTMFLAGAVMFSSMVLMPEFLQMLMGYTAEDAGLVVSIGSALVMVTMPIVGFLASRIPAKYLIAFGWFLSAGGLYESTKLLSMNISFGGAAVIILLQFAPLAFIFLPAITASYIGIPLDKSNSVAGLTNFMRNIGMSFGTAAVQTILARRQQFHLARIADHLSLGSPGLAINAQAMALHSRSAGLGVTGTQAAILARIYRSFMMQASTLSFIDAYVILGIGSVAMFFISFLLKSNDPKATEQHSGH
ncbi:MAG: DHA2 family efflux MFS transporter permease subunit [Terracidiphilus sp.]|nr:DHA2 family efflux MFS transporter permease subunit [Terracidiphilus sp.]